MKKHILIVQGGGHFFWNFQQAQSYYQVALVNSIGFHGKGMLLAGGCGDTNGPPQIGKTGHLERAYAFGRNLYSSEITQKSGECGSYTIGYVSAICYRTGDTLHRQAEQIN